MPLPRVPRSFASRAFRPAHLSHVALASALVLAGLGACKSSSSGDGADKTEEKSDKSAKAAPSASAQASADPSAAPESSAAKADPSASADPSAKTEPEDDQRNAKGGFNDPKKAPPPVPLATIQPVVFDTEPPEVKLPPVKEEEGHCGEVDVGGGDKVFLDCATDDYGAIPGAAKTFAGSEDFTGSKKPRNLPKVVDHRKDGTEGAILSQGKAPSCTAFSLTTVADHAAAHFLGHPADLSPMHAWARYHSPKMALADNDNIGKGLTDLETFPYDAKEAASWSHGSRVDHEALRRADAHALIEITNITHVETNNMNQIKSVLAAGQDVWFSIKGAHGLQHPKKNSDGESMISHFDSRKTGGAQSGHAIVLAGYEETAKGTFYLIHNSWGPKWGTEGYAWIWEKTLKANITSAYVLTVKPTELAHSRKRSHNHKFAACSVGLAPDAVTAQCVPPCEDSGPRVNGVCPTAGQCPEGEVNLDGKCEVSAPVLEKTLSNGVKMTCGVSGCTYVVPNGTASCSVSSGCNVSCAAPRFMLGSGTRGLSCSG